MSTMETLSVIKSKVSNLEHAVDKLANDVVHIGKCNDHASIRYTENCQSVASPGISNTSTPRPSIDMQDRNSSARSSRNKDAWEGKEVVIRNKSNSISPCLDSRRRPLSMVNRNSIGNRPKKSTGHDVQNMNYCQRRQTDRVVSSTSQGLAQQKGNVNENGIWKHVKALLCDGDFDSAYREALYSGDQLLLIELIDGTGPVLDSLSNETISNLFTALASCVLEHRIVESIIPWLQQVIVISF